MESGNNPLVAAGSLASAAVLHYSPAHLARGGPLNRAARELRRGRSPGAAAAIAARQGKGHVAEVRQAAEFTLNSAVLDEPFMASPNLAANDPQIDVEVWSDQGRVTGAQIGVGRPAYIAPKIRRSLAPQVVVNKETRDHLIDMYPDLEQLSTDRLSHEDVGASPLSGERAEEDAREIIESYLEGKPALGVAAALAISAGSGLSSFVSSAGVSLLFDLVESLRRGTSLPADALDRACRAGARSGARTSLQTFLMVNKFLSTARRAYDAKLLHAVGRGATWTGAVADVVVSTAVDVVAWARKEITFEELLKRAGVHVFSAAGAAAGVVMALALTRRAPPWLRVITCAGFAWAGGSAGRALGEGFIRGAASGAAAAGNSAALPA